MHPRLFADFGVYGVFSPVVEIWEVAVYPCAENSPFVLCEFDVFVAFGEVFDERADA